MWKQSFPLHGMNWNFNFTTQSSFVSVIRLSSFKYCLSTYWNRFLKPIKLFWIFSCNNNRLISTFFNCLFSLYWLKIILECHSFLCQNISGYNTPPQPLLKKPLIFVSFKYWIFFSLDSACTVSILSNKKQFTFLYHKQQIIM